MSIYFHYNQRGFRLKDAGRHKEWLKAISRNEGFDLDRVDYVFTGIEEITRINKEFLNHSYPTDVIAFDYGTEKLLSGEIYISPQIVKRNARHFSVTFPIEIRRVIVHALLHLMGYDDSNEDEKALMRKKEDEALIFYKNEF